jgi:tetratricopeptide (TPR) repeat protein
VIATAALAAAALQSASPPIAQDPRLAECLAQARSDPTTAILNGASWLGETSGSGSAGPQTCLGVAYTSLLRWQAASDAFLAARDATPETDLAGRARLGAMAGNALLAVPNPIDALPALRTARDNARAAGRAELAGETAVDLARAYVALDRAGEAEAALAEARTDAPQFAFGWLLSATLARRTGDLAAAQAYIETAIGLAPEDLEAGLEAGVIAALGGRVEAARASFNSVVALAPDSEQAKRARAYLEQMGD